jgi:hypothetical protein
MKKISAEEVEKIMTKPAGYGSLVRKALFSLKPGEGLIIENKDWTWKSQTPGTYCKRLSKQGEAQFEANRIIDGSGWLAKRIK